MIYSLIKCLLCNCNFIYVLSPMLSLIIQLLVKIYFQINWLDNHTLWYYCTFLGNWGLLCCLVKQFIYLLNWEWPTDWLCTHFFSLQWYINCWKMIKENILLLLTSRPNYWFLILNHHSITVCLSYFPTNPFIKLIFPDEHDAVVFRYLSSWRNSLPV